MPSWLVSSSPDRAVLVRALAGDLGKTLHSHSASFPAGVSINGYRRIVGEA